MPITQKDIDFIQSSNDIRVVIVSFVTNRGPVSEQQIEDWLRMEYNPTHIPTILDYWLPELESHGEIMEEDGMWHAGTIKDELGRPRGWSRKLGEVRSIIRMLILESNSTTGYKMIFLAGLPGGGKSTLLRILGIGDKFTNCNIDNFFEPTLMDNLGTKNLHDLKNNFFRLHKLRKEKLEAGQELTPQEIEEFERAAFLNKEEGRLFRAAIDQFTDQIQEVCQIGSNFIIDGTAANSKMILKQKAEYEAAGYDCAMIFVDIDPEVSMERNLARGQSGGRAIHNSIIRQQGPRVTGNIPTYEQAFGQDFFLVSNRGTIEEYEDAIELIRPGVDAFMAR